MTHKLLVKFDWKMCFKPVFNWYWVLVVCQGFWQCDLTEVDLADHWRSTPKNGYLDGAKSVCDNLWSTFFGIKMFLDFCQRKWVASGEAWRQLEAHTFSSKGIYKQQREQTIADSLYSWFILISISSLLRRTSHLCMMLNHTEKMNSWKNYYAHVPENDEVNKSLSHIGDFVTQDKFIDACFAAWSKNTDCAIWPSIQMWKTYKHFTK